MDTAQQSIPYLASWAEQAPVAALQATAGLIDRLALRIEDALTPPAVTVGQVGPAAAG